jgi:hypothetical protein
MKLVPAFAIVLTMAVVVTADGVPTRVTYVPHDTVSTTMAKGGSIIDDKGLIVLAQRRTAGEVEVHAKTNHVFIIVEGEATFVTGGTLVDGQTAPNQPRGERAGRRDPPFDQRRRDHDSGQDAALVQGSAVEDDRLLRHQHGTLAGAEKGGLMANG